jgi:hypothetical protein
MPLMNAAVTGSRDVTDNVAFARVPEGGSFPVPDRAISAADDRSLYNPNQPERGAGMNAPGFTAELSLYKTKRHYHEANRAIYASGGLYPAQLDFAADDLGQSQTSFGETNCRVVPYLGWCYGADGPYQCWKLKFFGCG